MKEQGLKISIPLRFNYNERADGLDALELVISIPLRFNYNLLLLFLLLFLLHFNSTKVQL